MSVAVLEVMRTIEQMDDYSAKAVFDWLGTRFQGVTQLSWDDIEEVEPDEIDLEMLREIETNPDCHEFVSEDEMFERLLSKKVQA